MSSMTGSMSSGPELVHLPLLTLPVVEIDQPCGVVVWDSNAARSLRRVLGILLEAEQASEASAINTPRIYKST